jgi:hypothetical protein
LTPLSVAFLMLIAAACWYGGRQLLKGDLPRWWTRALDRRSPWLVAVLVIPLVALVGLGLAFLWFWIRGDLGL